MTQYIRVNPPITWPTFPVNTAYPGTNYYDYHVGFTNQRIDFGGEKMVYIGEVCFPEGPGTSKVFSTSGPAQIGFYTDTQTVWNTANTTLRVGLQDLGTGNQPAIPDGTWDVYGEMVQGTDAMGDDGWNECLMSSGSKTLTHGDLVAVVFELTVRNGSDVVEFVGLRMGTTNSRMLPQVNAYLSSAWQTASLNHLPNVTLKSDDGTLCGLAGCWPFEGVTNTFFDNADTSNEYGMVLRPPFNCKVGGGWAQAVFWSSGDAYCEMKLYEDPFGSSPVLLASKVIPANVTANTASAGGFTFLFDSYVELKADQDYVLAMLSKHTTDQVRFDAYLVNDASHLALCPMGANSYLVSRGGSSGAFSVSNSKAQAPCGLNIDYIAGKAAPRGHMGI